MSTAADTLERLHEAATPGPWVATDVYDAAENVHHNTGCGHVELANGEPLECDEEGLWLTDAALIVAQRNAAPAMVALLEAAGEWHCRWQDVGGTQIACGHCPACRVGAALAEVTAALTEGADNGPDGG